MGERLDELCETAADEQENGRSKKSRHARRWVLLVVVLSVAALAWSCVFHGGLTRKPASFLATNDAVVAVRLGSGWSTVAEDFRYNDYDGWIVLLDADGRGQVAAVNNVLDGDVVWNERGVFSRLPHDPGGNAGNWTRRPQRRASTLCTPRWRARGCEW